MPCLGFLRRRGPSPLIVAAFSFQPIQAQVLYGSVVGLVEDPSGSSVPGAEITITNKETGQVHTTKSDQDGRYPIGNVSPGNYDLKVVRLTT